MEQKQRQSSWQQFTAVLGWFVFICRALAVSVEVFLHRNFGERYIGLQGAAVILLIPLYTVFWPEYDVSLLMAFLVAFLILCFVIRLGNMVRAWRGEAQEHTLYTGFPRLMSIFRNLNERKVKMVYEPVLVFFGGAITIALSEPLGSYLMAAGVGLMVSTHLSVGFERTRSLDALDSAIDMRQFVERFRALRGDRY